MGEDTPNFELEDAFDEPVPAVKRARPPHVYEHVLDRKLRIVRENQYSDRGRIEFLEDELYRLDRSNAALCIAVSCLLVAVALHLRSGNA